MLIVLSGSRRRSRRSENSSQVKCKASDQVIEQEARLAREIEPAEGSAMDGFEVETEGIYSGKPPLLDFLSDEPVLGVS
jgi:hypothetical protein